MPDFSLRGLQRSVAENIKLLNVVKWRHHFHPCSPPNAYFGLVYYWTEGLTVVSYHFDPHFKSVPRKTWYSPDGKKMTGGGYSQRSTRHRTAVRGQTFNLATDFEPKQRYWWEGNGIKVPDAKFFMQRHDFSQT